MKKLLMIAAVLTIGMVSCKKEDETKPAVKAEKSVMAGVKKDLSYWD